MNNHNYPHIVDYCRFEKPKSIYILQQHQNKTWKMPLHITPNIYQQHIEERRKKRGEGKVLQIYELFTTFLQHPTNSINLWTL